MIYWLTPATKNTFRRITPGALVFVFAWLGFTLGFSAYLSVFGTFNRVYGSLGLMMALLIWLYGSNFALLLGAELNAVLGKSFDPEIADAQRKAT